jgi:hypothetical protein
MNWMGGSLNRNSKGAYGSKKRQPRRISKAKPTATAKLTETCSLSSFQPNFFQYEDNHSDERNRQTTLDEYPDVAPVVQRLRTMGKRDIQSPSQQKATDPRPQRSDVVIDLTADDEERQRRAPKSDTEAIPSDIVEPEEINITEKRLVLLNRIDWAELKHTRPVELIQSRKRREKERKKASEPMLSHYKLWSLVQSRSKRDRNDEYCDRQQDKDGPLMSGALPSQRNREDINIMIGTDALASSDLSPIDDELENEFMLLDQKEVEEEIGVEPIVPMFDQFAPVSFPFQELPLSQMPQLRSELVNQDAFADHKSHGSSEIDDILSEILQNDQSTLPHLQTGQNLDNDMASPQLPPYLATIWPTQATLTKNVSHNELVVPMITRNSPNNSRRSNPTNTHALPMNPQRIQTTTPAKDDVRSTISNPASRNIDLELGFDAWADLQSGAIFTPPNGWRSNSAAARPSSSEEVALTQTYSTASDYRDIETLATKPCISHEQGEDEDEDVGWMKFVFGSESGTKSDDEKNTETRLLR